MKTKEMPSNIQNKLNSFADIFWTLLLHSEAATAKVRLIKLPDGIYDWAAVKKWLSGTTGDTIWNKYLVYESRTGVLPRVGDIVTLRSTDNKARFYRVIMVEHALEIESVGVYIQEDWE